MHIEEAIARLSESVQRQAAEADERNRNLNQQLAALSAAVSAAVSAEHRQSDATENDDFHSQMQQQQQRQLPSDSTATGPAKGVSDNQVAMDVGGYSNTMWDTANSGSKSPRAGPVLEANTNQVCTTM